ncbi:MAG: hypothetical protein P9M15_06700 [Candidatus Electryoneaceae bacterium]|nr:hypothetical protein [Candidatus Electryoneaceae bacterium]
MSYVIEEGRVIINSTELERIPSIAIGMAAELLGISYHPSDNMRPLD